MRGMYYGADGSEVRHLSEQPPDRLAGAGNKRLWPLCGAANPDCEGLIDLDVKRLPAWAGESGPDVVQGMWCTTCVRVANWG